MAIQTGSLSSAEHDWFATRSGEPSNVSVDSHKRSYFVSKGIAGSVAGRTKPLSQMEDEWLNTLTGVTASGYADKWSQAVSGQSLTPNKDGIDANKFIFYTSVSTSP